MSTLSDDDYEVVITAEPQRIVASQRLRQQVFAAEYGWPDTSGLDIDRFDAYCDHLMINHRPTGTVAGTCRMLRPGQAADAGGHYSDELFDLSPIRDRYPSLMEIGRLAVHPGHRNGAVVGRLWGEILRWARAGRCRWLGGCMSIPLAGGDRSAAATWQYIRDRSLLLPDLTVRPHARWTATAPHRPDPALVPPLLRGYLRLGALVGGPPAHDAVFGSADLFVLLDLEHANQRYLDRFTRLAAAG